LSISKIIEKASIINKNDDKRLKDLIDNGYLISVTLEIDKTLENNINNLKLFFILHNSKTNKKIGCVTGDQVIIDRVLKQQKYQKEPIGTQIYAYCAALGGKSSKERFFHLEDLIKSINGFQNWEFKISDRIGTFKVIIKIESIEKSQIEKTFSDLQFLLDCMAHYYQVGFQIQHYNISPIPRLDIIFAWGPEERRLESFDKEIILKIGKLISNEEIRNIAHGINQSYTENNLTSRITILWAAVEQAFQTSPKHLLRTNEIEEILKIVSNIETLKTEPERLKKLKSILKDPDRIPSISRNTRIAQSVSKLLKLDNDMIDKKIKDISKLRGRHVHSITPENIIEFENAENFLRDILEKYMKKIMGTELIFKK
jgi:hypothetical protein